MEKDEKTNPTAQLTAGAYRDGGLTWPTPRSRKRLNERQAQDAGEDQRDQSESYAGGGEEPDGRF